jgi:hypothetical protein
MMPVVPTSYLPPSPALSSFESESLTSQLDGLPLPPSSPGAAPVTPDKQVLAAIVPCVTLSKSTTVVGRGKKVKAVKAANKKLKLKFRLRDAIVQDTVASTSTLTATDSHFTPDEACRAKLQASCGSFFRTMAGCDGEDPLYVTVQFVGADVGM